MTPRQQAGHMTASDRALPINAPKVLVSRGPSTHKALPVISARGDSVDKRRFAGIADRRTEGVSKMSGNGSAISAFTRRLVAKPGYARVEVSKTPTEKIQ
jgi:hypothetical protein